MKREFFPKSFPRQERASAGNFPPLVSSNTKTGGPELADKIVR